MTPAVVPPGVCFRSLSTRTNIVGRLPTVTGCPCFGAALQRELDRRPVAVLERDGDRRSRAARADASARCATPRRSAGDRRPLPASRARVRTARCSSRSCAADRRSACRAIATTRQPGRTADAAAPSTLVTSKLAADEPDVEARVGAEIGRRRAARRAASPPTTESARSATGRDARACRERRRAARRSDLAAAARGLSSARTPSQFTPFIVLSKCESRIVVHAASNVSTPLRHLRREQAAERQRQPSADARGSRRRMPACSLDERLDRGRRLEDRRVDLVELDRGQRDAPAARPSPTASSSSAPAGRRTSCSPIWTCVTVIGPICDSRVPMTPAFRPVSTS